MDFLRFPHTPHLVWLGPGTPRGDKVMSPQEASALLSDDVVVEEKVDGANIGLSVTSHGVQIQSRGAILKRGETHPQFRPLFPWLDARRVAVIDRLEPHLIVFGEWCYAMHSVRYTSLPDWFLAFDVYDRSERQFWSVPRRDSLVDDLGLQTVPKITRGHFSMLDIKSMLGSSKLTKGQSEGLYIRRDDAKHLVARAKVVRPEFTQGIEAHWSGRSLETNRLSSGATY